MSPSPEWAPDKKKGSASLHLSSLSFICAHFCFSTLCHGRCRKKLPRQMLATEFELPDIQNHKKYISVFNKLPSPVSDILLQLHKVHERQQ